MNRDHGAAMITFSSGGETVVIRPIGAADFELERAFVRGLSLQTGIKRLMSPRQPTDDELRRWTDVDQWREVAFIAVTLKTGHERGVGVVRYVVDDTEEIAEFAVVLSDAWQHRGLGRAMLSALIEHARRAGLQRLVGPTLAENDAMIGLARSLGFTAQHEAGTFVTELALELNQRLGQPDPVEAARRRCRPRRSTSREGTTRSQLTERNAKVANLSVSRSCNCVCNICIYNVAYEKRHRD